VGLRCWQAACLETISARIIDVKSLRQDLSYSIQWMLFAILCLQLALSKSPPRHTKRKIDRTPIKVKVGPSQGTPSPLNSQSSRIGQPLTFPPLMLSEYFLWEYF